jgi:Bifunctional DNA primase/polymerase, N-terminal
MVRNIARGYTKRGWSPIPVPADEKNPAMKGWQQLRITEANLNKHFNGARLNIGVLLGEPSGGLIDLDLDCDEAVKLAPKFLPDTATFGREHNPASHRLYRCAYTLPETRKFSLPKEDGGICDPPGANPYSPDRPMPAKLTPSAIAASRSAGTLILAPSRSTRRSY